MSQTIVNMIEVAIILGFFWSVSYQPQPAQSNNLKKIRKIGSLSGAIILPLSLLVVVMINGSSLGGPLFWPLFAALSGMLGFTVATLYFILRRAKPKT